MLPRTDLREKYFGFSDGFQPAFGMNVTLTLVQAVGICPTARLALNNLTRLGMSRSSPF